MKKIIIIFVMVMMCSSVVLASTPKFSTTKLLENNVDNGKSSFGNLLFIKETHTPKYYNLSGFTPSTYQQFDIVTWHGESITIDSPTQNGRVLVNGSRYVFTEYGLYKITSMINVTKSVMFSVLRADDVKVNITNIETPIGISLGFSTYIFTIVDEKTVSANISIDDDVRKGVYSLSFKINGQKMIHNFTILENINWTMNTTNFTKSPTIKSGEGLYLGRIVLENIGNEDIEMTITKSGNQSGLINIPKPQTLYRKNVMNLDFQANVPTIMKAGIYNIEIKVSGGGIHKIVKLNISVVDSIAPTIDSIEFYTDRVFVDNSIRVFATDNDDVKNVTMQYDGETFGFKKDGNLFVRECEFNKLSRYIFNFCAEDFEGNKVCQVMNKTFVKLDIINGSQKVLKMDSMRYGKYSRIKLFNITEKVEGDLLLQIISQDMIPNTNITPVFRVVNGEGSIKTFGKYDNGVSISDPGEYFLEIRADSEVKIGGVLRATLPEQYEAIEDMTYDVSFKNYDVPSDFTKEWVGGRDMVCKVIDSGNLDTSYYDCNLKYPIDTRTDDISVPTTVKERTTFEEEAENVRAELDDSKKMSAWIIGSMGAILLMVILWGVYMIMWAPYVRFKTGKPK